MPARPHDLRGSAVSFSFARPEQDNDVFFLAEPFPCTPLGLRGSFWGGPASQWLCCYPDCLPVDADAHARSFADTDARSLAGRENQGIATYGGYVAGSETGPVNCCRVPGQ